MQALFVNVLHSLIYNYALDALLSTAASLNEDLCSDGDIRLAGGEKDITGGLHHGFLQICTGKVWGAVCDDLYFDDTAAAVVCNSFDEFIVGGNTCTLPFAL